MPGTSHDVRVHVRPGGRVADVALELGSRRVLRDGPWSRFVVDGEAPLGPRGEARYAVDLAAAARAGASFEGLRPLRSGHVVRPQVLLPHLDEDDAWAIEVVPPEGWSVSCGLMRDARGRFVLRARTGFESPFLAVGPFDRADVRVGDAVVEVAVAGAAPVAEDVLGAWVERAAVGVAGLYGSFPAPRLQLLLACGDPGKLGFGLAMGNGGWSVVAWVGRATTAQQLRDDWILPHEMVHVGWPRLGGHTWLTEGVATYAGPWGRVLAGGLAAGEAFETMTGMFAHGQAAPGDHGLDLDETWGRTYWGGAAWCLELDVALAQASRGEVRFWDLLRAVRAQGWSIAGEVGVGELLRVMDDAAGGPYASQAYERHARRAVPFDLDRLEAAGRKLWRRAA